VCLEDVGATRRLGAGVDAVVGGPVLCRQKLSLRDQHERQKESGSTQLTSVSHVVQIVPEVWEDPIGK
jgi:hypothetical protein